MSQPTKKRDGKDILTVLYETWRHESKGQKIVACWIGGIVVASIWGIYIKRRLTISNKNETPPPITRQLPDSFLLKNQENSIATHNQQDNKIDDRQISLMSTGSDAHETPQHIDHKHKGDCNKFSTFREVLDIAIPSMFSSPILWSTLLSTSLIWKSSNVSSVNDCIGVMGELLVCKKWRALSLSTMDFAIKTIYASVAISTVTFLSSSLSLSLRDNLTKYFMCNKFINKYGNHDNIAHLYHCKQEIVDIDNRICSDMNEWSSKYAVCFVTMVKPLIDVALYSNKLSQRLGLYYFGQCMFYFVISSAWTRSALPSHSFMKANLLKQESVFLNNNKRLIEYVEEIHYLGGIATEIKMLDDSYCLLYNKLSSQSIYDLIYEFSQNYVVRYLGILASFVSLLPMIKNEKKPTEFLLNNLHDLVNIGLAFRDLMRSLKEFETLKGISSRIIKLKYKLDETLKIYNNQQMFIDNNDFDDLLEEEESNNNKQMVHNKPYNIDIYKDEEHEEYYYQGNNVHGDINEKKQMIIFENVNIETPDRAKLLLLKFNFSIKLGENVLIWGENGVGKSALIRVICGLWKCAKGKIKINSNNKSADIYFLPSRSYLIPGLSIKQQLMYPDIYNEQCIENEAIIELLNHCGLGKLIQYIDDINDTMHITDTFWCHLSDGESQLICLCRVLIKKPKLLFIDESFNNLSLDKIDWFYQQLSTLNITVVTITHNTNNKIKLYHDVILNLNGDGDGKYSIQKI